MPDAEINPDIDPLTRLAIRHGTDKWGPHFYTPIYHELLFKLRERPVRLLEIGVGGYGFKTLGGGSLAMWAEYFPDGEITGIDIAEKRLDLGSRVSLYRGSQDDPDFLKRVGDERGPFDVILDDGSHVPKHVVTSFQILFPFLVDDGLYIVEDVQTAFWPNFGGSVLHGGETLKLARTVIECLNHAEISLVDRTRSFPYFAKNIKSLRAYHNLLVIEKGDNGEPSNGAYDLSNARAADAIGIMERELEAAPTAEGLANLAQLYLRGGNREKAKEIADKAVAQWPRSTAALSAAYAAAKSCGDFAASVDYLERFLQCEPDNSVMQAALQQAQTNPPRSGATTP